MSALPNPDLLYRIPLTARTVLDVGCNTGALGAAYRQMNPAARIYGIDRDLDHAKQAARLLDVVANVDLNLTPAPFPADTRFDCMIYGDVLEHTLDPAAVLRAQLPYLAEDGVVLICLPNVEHWHFARRLLDGSWAYEPEGLLDATHMRWFTTRSIDAMLREAGLEVIDMAPRIFGHAEHAAFIAAITPALTNMGIDIADYANRSAPLQTVWRARRAAPTRLHVVAHRLEPQGGVSDVRIILPQIAINTDPSISASLIASATPPALPTTTPKILILHRLGIGGPGGRQYVRDLLAAGWVIVTEFDDHPDYMPVMQIPELLTFAGVHAVQTSTPALAEVLRGMNPNVALFPNMIRHIEPPRNFADPSRVGLFFGAFNRERDWAEWMPALNQVLAVAGPRMPVTVLYDQQFFDALQTEHKTFLPMTDYDTYLARLAECEISLMPLTDTSFNRTKSDLKYIEAASRRVLAIASPTVYGASITDGQTGFIVADAAQMQARLMQVLADPTIARDIADRARADIVQHRMLASQVQQRVDWYHALWARRAELTMDMLARVPELAAPEPAAPELPPQEPGGGA